MRPTPLTALRCAAAVVVTALFAGCGPIPLPTRPDVPTGDDAPVGVDLTPAEDAPAPPDAVALDAGPPGFCARALCSTATPRCCESLMRCIAADARCPDDPPPPPVDAGPAACRANADCGRGGYCAGASCDGPGSCQTRPDACPELYAPVCGCDGRTFGNACEAASAGVRVAARGACPTTSFCATVRCAAGTRCCEALRACIPTTQGCPSEPPPPDAGVASCASARDCGRGQECVFPDAVCARSGTCQDAIACLRAETFCSCAGETYLGCRPDRPTRSRGACAAIDGGVASCRSNADCGAAQYCAGAGCGTAGACEARPEACTREYAPVCGCDGRTYGNACAAAASGVRVSARGECPTSSFCAAALCLTGTRCCEALRACIPAADRCPGDPLVDAGVASCTTARECGRNQECVYPDAACARSGTCQDAIACLRAETFCGCDGATYAGCRPDRPTQSRGACPAVDGGVTRCRTNADCARGAYCAGAGCDTAGTCAARPEACTTLYDPVCGCDGRTYGNACSAASAGVRVSARGACPTTSFCAAALCAAGTRCCEALRACLPGGVLCPIEPPVDGGVTRCRANADCGAAQYCAGAGCDTAGTCEARPEVCTREYAPVCGCDGRTYSTACTAAAAGVRVSARGECPTTSFCALVRCAAGTRCCEALRACIPTADRCPGDPAADAGVASCASARECGRGQECVFPDAACARSGTCQDAIACLRAETFCSCAGDTYLGCRPDRPTQSRGACR